MGRILDLQMRDCNLIVFLQLDGQTFAGNTKQNLIVFLQLDGKTFAGETFANLRISNLQTSESTPLPTCLKGGNQSLILEFTNLDRICKLALLVVWPRRSPSQLREGQILLPDQGTLARSMVILILSPCWRSLNTIWVTVQT